MSILIRGMEMPKSCGYCPLRHEARDGDECYLGASLTEYQKRPDDCPLIPVQPHGDLIDRDALLDTATIHWSQTTNESCFPIDEIEYATTVIPADGKDIKVPTREEGE